MVPKTSLLKENVFRLKTPKLYKGLDKTEKPGALMTVS